MLMQPAADHHQLIQAGRAVIGGVQVMHDKGHPLVAQIGRLPWPTSAQPFRAGAFGKMQIAGVINHATRIGILIINPQRQTMNRLMARDCHGLGFLASNWDSGRLLQGSLKGGHPRQGFAFQPFQKGTTRQRNIADLVGNPRLGQGGHGIPTARNRQQLPLSR